jgi:WD40 repeat protein
MDTLGVKQKKPHISKLAISSLIILVGTSPFGLYLFLLFLSNIPNLSYGFGPALIIVYILLFPIFTIIAIVLDILSLWRIHEHPDLLKGKVIAWLGIVLGSLMILAWIGWIWSGAHIPIPPPITPPTATRTPIPTSTIRPRVITQQANTVDQLIFSPDGKLLVFSDFDSNIIVWDLAANRAKFSIQLKKNPNASVTAWDMALSPDGHLLAIPTDVDRVNQVYLVDTVLGKLLDPIKPAGDEGANAAAFSPDGTMLALGGKKQVTLWNVQTRTSIGTLSGGQRGGYLKVAFSPDGKTLATVTYTLDYTVTMDNAITLWDVQTRKQLGQPLEMSLDEPHNLRFSPDGKRLTFLTGVLKKKKVLIWDITTRQMVGSLSVEACDLVFSPDGKVLAVGTCPTSPSGGLDFDEGVVYLFDATTYVQIDDSPLTTGHPSGIFCLAFGPDSRTIASGDMDGNVYLWDLP